MNLNQLNSIIGVLGIILTFYGFFFQEITLFFAFVFWLTMGMIKIASENQEMANI